MSTDLDLPDALRAAMRGHTADVLPAPALVDTVLRGGARRRLQTRLTLAAVPVLVVAAVVGGTALAPRLGPSNRGQDALPAADGALLARPTQGDLADDGSYVQAVTVAWTDNYRTSGNAGRGIFDHLLSRPKVLWAGTTPVGPAAVVAQSADLRPHEGIQLDNPGPALLWGFVSADPAGAVRVVADGYPVEGAPSTEAAFIGPDRNVILVLDRGHPVEASFGRRQYTDDGRVERSWQPVDFPDPGVAVLSVPAGTDRSMVVLSVGLANRSDTPSQPPTTPENQVLHWSDPDGHRPVWLAGVDPGQAWGDPPDAVAAQGVLQTSLRGRVPLTFPEVSGWQDSSWYVVGRTPDGSRLVTGEIALDPDPGRVYAVLRSPSGRVDVAARWSDVDGPLPVAVPLPRGQGWVVAQKGATLGYRTASGSWQPAGTNAALLPDAAVAVRIVHNGRTDEVPLHR